MKKRLYTIWITSIALAAIFVGMPTVVSGQQNFPAVNQMRIDAQLNKDGRLIVTETVTYDFGNQPRRGVARELAVPKRGAVTIQSVSRDGLKEKYRIAQAGRYKQIRTGTAGISITDEHKYTFKYSIRKPLRAAQSGVQFVWPVIPGVRVPAENITVNLQLPGSSDSVRCRIGVQNKGCPVDRTDTGVQATVSKLEPGERLTIRANIPKSVLQVTFDKGSGRQWVYWAGLALMALVVLLWLWYRFVYTPQREAPEPKTPEHIDTLDE